MKMGKRIISFIMVLVYLFTSIPLTPFMQEVSADVDGDIYSIQNDFIKYSINAATGGFSVETLEGNPLKELDDNIPLLYRDDLQKSVATSFTTIRIGTGEDAKDYIFGKSYDFLGLEIHTKLNTPVISDGGQLITTSYELYDYVITQRVALSVDITETQTGTVGISYEVENKSDKEETVSIRVLLDTALGNDVDAPYLNPLTAESSGSVIMDEAIVTETAFYKTPAQGQKAIPDQIRGLDSKTSPEKISYLILNEAVNDHLEPDKMIFGHWANLANTRYEYTPDRYTDFSNYSNNHRVPDAAVALYWENILIPAGENEITAEMLYGVGNFDADQLSEGLGLLAEFDKKIELNDAKTGYKDDEFTLTLNLDNNVTNSRDLKDISIELVLEEGSLISFRDNDTYNKNFTELKEGAEPLDVTFKLKVAPSEKLTAEAFAIGITATATSEDGIDEPVTYSIGKNLLIPGIKNSKHTVNMAEVAPKIVYTEGTKNITVAGNMEELKALQGTDDWALWLVHENGKNTDGTRNDQDAKNVEINKSRIAFLDEDYTALSISTSAELVVGDYEIVFEFDEGGPVGGLHDTFGKSLKASKTFEVSNDEKYKIRSYGIMTLVRTKGGSQGNYNYSFVPFDTETAYNAFLDGGSAVDVDNIPVEADEVLLVIRGNIQEATDNGETYYTASPVDSNITINNILTYVGNTPLIMRKSDTSADDYELKVSGDGLIKVVDSIDVWNSDWSLSVENSNKYSLRGDDGSTTMTLNLEGVGYMLQAVAGFLIEMKFGELSAEYSYEEGSNTKVENIAYGISFGGRISLPIMNPSSKSKNDTAETNVRTADTDGAGSNNGNSGDSGSTGDNNGSSGDSGNSDNSGSNNDPDEEDYGLADLFNEEDGSQNNDADTGSIDTNSSSGSSGNTGSSSSSSNGGKEEGVSASGTLTAEIEDILYGQSLDNLEDIGFVGIDTTVEIGLPADLLGSLISNAPGVSASLTIDTISPQEYTLDMALALKVIECEGTLSFAETEINGAQKIVPDMIAFYIRDGLKIPLAPPTPLFMTGLGGGISNLADTIGGEFKELPPITILLGMNLELVEVLVGQLDGSFSLEGLTIEGNFGLESFGKTNTGSTGNPGGNTGTGGQTDSTTTDVTDVTTGNSGIDISATLNARWIDPVEFSISGEVSVIGGLLKGRLSIIIAPDYFYGYAMVGVFIPDSIPVIGGLEVASVEAAVSTDFIGANVTLIGIKFGAIYYWDGEYSFGGAVDLSPRARMATFNQPQVTVNESGERVHAIYGTNIKPIETTPVEPIAMRNQGVSLASLNIINSAVLLANNNLKTATVDVTDATGADSLLIEIPFSGGFAPKASDVTLETPGGQTIHMVESDGVGGGNYLAQFMPNGSSSMYISVTGENAQYIKNGDWTVNIVDTRGKLTLGNIQFNSASNISEVSATSFERTGGTDSFIIDKVSYTVENSTATDGTVNVYLTQNKNALGTTDLGTVVASKELDNGIAANGEITNITLPEGFESGEYYVITTLSVDTGGMSSAISADSFTFVNPNLPKPVAGVTVGYAGDGELYVDITDAEGYNDIANPNDNYTHYLVEIVEEDGTSTNIMGQFVAGQEDIFLGKGQTISSFTGIDEDGETTGDEEVTVEGLKPGVTYKAVVRTLREEPEDGLEMNKYFYGTEMTSSSNSIEMPEIDIPVLESVESNISRDTVDSNAPIIVSEDELRITYKFDRPVWMVWDANGEERTAGEFKEEWNIVHPLVDGKYVVDFKVFGANKDSATSADYKDKLNAVLGFETDTTSPVLSLTESVKEDIKNSARTRVTPTTTKVANNIVMAENNGDYTITGITEVTAALSTNAPNATVDTDHDGSFKITGNVGTAGVLEVTITAKDKAGNESIILVNVINSSLSTINEITLYQRVENEDGSTDLVKVEEVTDAEHPHFGYPYLEIGYFDTVELVAVYEDGNNVIEIENTTVTWEILYEKNKIRFYDGTLTAIDLGETAVGASLPVGVYTDASGDTSISTLDASVIINVVEGNKDELIKAVNDAKASLANPKNASSADKAALQKAIDEAQAVLDAERATPEEIQKALEDLLEAITDFETAKNQSSGSGSNSIYAKITAEAGENGRVELSHDLVRKGTSLTITSIPDAGYEVASVEVNGKYYSNENVITIPSVNEDLYIYVTFAKAWVSEFSDVANDAWYYDAVRFVYSEGLMNGTGGGLFSPNTNLNRGMLVTILGRMAEADVENLESIYDDVKEGMFYSQYATWATLAGITSGTGENNFSPERDITREEMAAMIYRFIVFAGGKLDPNDEYEIGFADSSSISGWAYEAITYLTKEGVLNGKPGNIFDPKGQATRAEIATVIQRLVRLMTQYELEVGPVSLPETEEVLETETEQGQE